jgi:hypothetical protein
LSLSLTSEGLSGYVGVGLGVGAGASLTGGLAAGRTSGGTIRVSASGGGGVGGFVGGGVSEGGYLGGGVGYGVGFGWTITGGVSFPIFSCEAGSMSLVDGVIGALLAGLVVLFGAVALVQRRFRGLMREGRSDRVATAKRFWESSPRETFTFLGRLLHRDHARMGDPSVRRWGDLLLVVYAAYTLVLATLAGVLIMRL